MGGGMGGDPRLFNPSNLVTIVRQRLGLAGGVSWGLDDNDIIRIIQSESLMLWSAHFSDFKDIKISICEANRVYSQKKGIYYHGLPQDQILLGIERVFPHTHQPASRSQIPGYRNHASGGTMTKANNAARELHRSTLNLTAVAYPSGANPCAVSFTPHLWLNEFNETLTLRVRLAHALDFSSIEPGYQEAFKDWATICVGTYLSAVVIPRLENMNTEVGQYSANQREAIGIWSQKYDEYKEMMSNESLLNPNRQKIFR